MAAGCTSTSTAPSQFAPFSQVDLQVGTGATAMTGSTLTVNYTGWLYDSTKDDNKGVIFDTSAGAEPFTFVLGSGQIIRGWNQGLVGMKVGGRRQLVIPPSLAYGQARVSAIPPNSTLIFEIDLVDVR